MNKMRKNISKKIILTLIFIFIIASVSAQNNPWIIRLVYYDADTHQSKIHIQNTAGFDLNEVHVYQNNFDTGRIAETFKDGNAAVYFLTIAPGTYDITVKTEEGIDFTREITFKTVTITSTVTGEEIPIKTGILAEEIEYQKFLAAREKEKVVNEYRKKIGLEELQKEEPLEQPTQKVTEIVDLNESSFEKPEPVDEKSDYNTTLIIISFLVFIFILIYIFKKRKKNVEKIKV